MKKFIVEPDNVLVLENMEKIIHLAKGAHTIDLVIRADGIDRTFQADWVKNMREHD